MGSEFRDPPTKLDVFFASCCSSPRDIGLEKPSADTRRVLRSTSIQALRRRHRPPARLELARFANGVGPQQRAHLTFLRFHRSLDSWVCVTSMAKSSHTSSAAALASSRTSFPINESPVRLYSAEGSSYRTLPKEIVRENPCFFIVECSLSYTSRSSSAP